jgi:hypothetical protein
MPDQRLLIGDYGNGTVGLKTSLPGYDVSVLADDSNPDRRSFNSEWTNILYTAQIGVVAGVTVSNVTIPINDLGFIPFYDVRCYEIDGPAFYDDRIVRTDFGGPQGVFSYGTALRSNIDRTSLTLQAATNATVWPSPKPAIYLIYKQQAF